MKGKIIFEEVQSFVGTWMWYLVIGISALIVGGSIITLTLSRSPAEGFIGVIISTIAMGGVIALLATARLQVKVDETRLYYRFPPFISKEKYFGQDDIQEMIIRKYRPIWEYGGHGYRFRFRSGRAISVSGNIGLQLVLKNGKRMLIGTQKPDSMRTAIRRLRENSEMNG